MSLPKDSGYVVLEIRSWGEGGDGPAHEIIVSRDSGRDVFTAQRVCGEHVSHLKNTAVILIIQAIFIKHADHDIT